MRRIHRHQERRSTVVLGSLLVALAAGCKPRQFNNAQTTSTGATAQVQRTADAQAEAFMPFWSAPKSIAELNALPTITNLGVASATWQSFLKTAFSESHNGGALRPLTLSNPECARSEKSWRVTAARLSLYELDLPGNVLSWRTLALQRETDLAQRVQLHVTVQPWCSSERLGRADFVHTLDHAFLLTFDLTTPHLPQPMREWAESFSQTLLTQQSVRISAEKQVLPYARALLQIHDGTRGRNTIVRAWNEALQTQQFTQNKVLPSVAWLNARQALSVPQGNLSTMQGIALPAFPALQANPSALNGFFQKFISEKNLIRVRAHITEGLGTSQRFLRWDRTGGKLALMPQQTYAAQWDRQANTVQLLSLLSQPETVVRVGAEQPTLGTARVQLKDVDLEETVLHQDVSVQELLSLKEKAIDAERTSVQSTRCVSCHGLDDALRTARDGRSVSQRGMTPAQLTLMGYNADATPRLNLRSLRTAEADAARFEEENLNDKRSSL